MARFVLTRLRREERGSVLVTVAIVLPTLIVLSIFAVDVANWYYHKNHLQTQADASALAAAQQITFSGTGACSSSGYNTTAQNYGQNQYNAQIGGTPAAEIHVGLGQASWFGQTDATVIPGDPCLSSMIDVKVAETNLPFLFNINLVPHIGSHARVEFKKEVGASKKSPISVRADQVKPYPFQTVLKLTGGSQTQATDCDPTGVNSLEDELASTSGCAPAYTVDPNPVPSQSDCTSFNPSTTAQPWFCVKLATGNAAGQVAHGLNKRVYGNKNQNTCPATNRINFPTLNDTDPRIVDVFITSYDFSGSGQTSIPVTGFATFYLTGWENDPCIGAASNPDFNPGNGGISGYFVRNVDQGGTGGNAPCVLSNAADLSTCVAVLTQ